MIILFILFFPHLNDSATLINVKDIGVEILLSSFWLV